MTKPGPDQSSPDPSRRGTGDASSEPPARTKKSRTVKSKSRRRWPTDVAPREPIDREKPQLSLRQRIENAGPGFATSLFVHVLLFLAMAWYTFFSVRSIGPGSIEAGWVIEKPRASSTNPPALNVEAFKPAKLATEAENPSPKTSRPNPAGGTGTMVEKKPQPRPVSPVDVRDLLADRDPENARQKLLAAGGDESTLQSIESGLKWLSRQQQPTGYWQLHTGYPDAGSNVLRTDTGATALAMLCFLGAGNTHEAGEFQSTVAKGKNWLIGVQKASGDFHDHVELGRQTAFYAHAQATIVMCELLLLSKDESLRPPTERAVTFLLNAQQPVTGGWKYRPLTADSVADLSVTGWALMALHTARAAKIEVPDEAFFRATRFLNSVQEDNGAAYKYEQGDPPDRVSIAMTAEGLLCRQYLGWPGDEPALQLGCQRLLGPRAQANWSVGKRNVYEWYYAAHVFHNLQDEQWKTWYQNVQRIIVDNQMRRGSTKRGIDVRGSWHPTKPEGSPHEYAQKAGRLYFTAMCVLILETPFRYRSVGHPRP